MTAQNTSVSDLLALAERVLNSSRSDNSLDVQVEIALFEPDEHYVAVRSNAAGTKVIYTDRSGRDHTHWAQDWTGERTNAVEVASALLARAARLNAGEGA